MSLSTRRFSALAVGLIAVGLVIAAGLAAYGVTCLKDYEIVDKGQLLEYTEATVWKVEFCGRHTVILEAEKRPDADYINASLLSAAGVIAVAFAYAISRMTGGLPRKLRAMAVATFAGMMFLAADESFGFHESLGHNLQGLRNIPLIGRPDDLVVASYAIPLVIFLWVFRDKLFVEPESTRLIGVAGGFFAAAAISDVIGFRFEEIFELASSAVLVWAMARIWTYHVGEALRPGRDPESVLAAHRAT